MATLLDLFTILDGYDQSNPPPRIDINPDPALARARLHTAMDGPARHAVTHSGGSGSDFAEHISAGRCRHARGELAYERGTLRCGTEQNFSA